MTHGPLHRSPQSMPRLSLQGALGWFLVTYGIAVVGYLGLYAIASRFLGPDSFGLFVIAVTATTVVGQFALLGVHRAGLREAARVGTGAEAALSELRAGVRAVCLVSLPLGGLLSGAVTWALAADEALGDRLTLALAVAGLVVLSGQQKLWANYLRGFGFLRFASLLEGRAGGALPALLQSLFVALEWIYFPELGLRGALAAVALGYLLPILVAGRFVSRQWRHVSMQPSLRRDLRQVVSRDWRFASGQLASYLNANLELWMAGLLLSAVNTSLFGAAQRLSLLVVAPLTSLQVVFSPAIARAGGTADRDRLEPLVRTGATIAAVPMVILLAPMLIAPDWVLRTVFGSDYTGGALTLVLLTIGSVANVLTGLCGAILSMTHREGTVATVQWIGLGARTVLGVGAAVLVGLEGLGASAGLVTAGIWVALWVSAYRSAGVRTHPTLHPRIQLLRETAG